MEIVANLSWIKLLICTRKIPPYGRATIERMAKHPPRPRDPNQLAKLIVDIATGEAHDPDMDAGNDAGMVVLGRKGGLKGGKGPSRCIDACAAQRVR